MGAARPLPGRQENRPGDFKKQRHPPQTASGGGSGAQEGGRGLGGVWGAEGGCGNTSLFLPPSPTPPPCVSVICYLSSERLSSYFFSLSVDRNMPLVDINLNKHQRKFYVFSGYWTLLFLLKTPLNHWTCRWSQRVAFSVGELSPGGWWEASILSHWGQDLRLASRTGGKQDFHPSSPDLTQCHTHWHSTRKRTWMPCYTWAFLAIVSDRHKLTSL